jgi:sn-glycerol 3-phosphate transport system substrate-binding protein
MARTAGPPDVTPPPSRRRAALLAPSAALLGACAGPGQSTSGPVPTEAGGTVQWASSDAGPDRVEHHLRQARQFEARRPGVTVELVPDGENIDKLRAGIAAGTPMDLVTTGSTRFAGLARQGALLALDDRIRRDRYDVRDFFPAGLAGWRWRERQWGLPFMGVLTPYVNLTVVEEAGARRPPATWKDTTWTWDAFLELGRKVGRSEGDAVTRYGYTGPADNMRQWLSWVWAAGGDLFDKDRTRVTLGDPPALAGLQFQSDLINRHRMMPSPARLRELGGAQRTLQEARAGLTVASVGAVAPLRRVSGLRWTVAALPRGPAGVAIGGGGSGWFLLNGSKQQDVAWELLKFIESVEQDKAQAVGGFAPPARRSVANDPEFLLPKEAPGPDMRAVVEALELAFRPDPVLVQGDEVFKIVGDELAPVWAGQRSAAEGAAQIKARVEPLLAGERA